MAHLMEHQRHYRDLARRLAEDQLDQHAARIDRDAVFPDENFQAFSRLGLNGLVIPKAYGGQGIDDVKTLCLITEELARACPSSSAILTTFNARPVIDHGNEDQKQAVLPRLARGEAKMCFAITEAHAGSDVSAISTTARRSADGWIIHGVKCQIGNAVGANYCVVAAKTDPDKGHDGISAFLVDKSLPGVSISKVYEKMGMRGTTTGEITFDNVIVPHSALLGEENRGSKVLFKSLDLGRLMVAARAVGVARGALEEAIAYARQRMTFGVPLADHQSIQFMVASMATEVHAARAMVSDACDRQERGERFSQEASMCKLFASEMVCRVTETAMQIFGGWGLLDRSKVERHFRDARYLKIWEGTSEIQRMIIARSIFR